MFWSAITPPYSNNALAVLLNGIVIVLVCIFGGRCNNDDYCGEVGMPVPINGINLRANSTTTLGAP
jgi:hypothetical protein